MHHFEGKNGKYAPKSPDIVTGMHYSMEFEGKNGKILHLNFSGPALRSQ